MSRCLDSGRRRAAWLVLPAVTVTLALASANAGAVIVHVRGRTLSYQPVPGSSSQIAAASPQVNMPLEYHGGPVMSSNTNSPLYWDPSGGPSYPAGYETGLNSYFEDLAHDSGGVQNTDSVLTQYKDGAGEFANYDSHFGGALIDTDPYPSNGCSAAPICLTDEQLRTEIAKYVGEHKLSTDLKHEYFLITPPGVESCFEPVGHSCSVGTTHATYCSYHAHISVAGGVIVYANDPYIDESGCDPGEEHPNDNPSDATLGGGLVHEHSESVTDPELNAWYDRKGNEVADKCDTNKQATEFGEPLGTAPDGAKYNQVIDGDLYWLQQEWGNEAGACLQRAGGPPPTVTRVSPDKGTASGGTTVTVSGANFTGATSVKFASNEGTSLKVNSSSSITIVSPAGTGTVNVTVTTPSGKSAVNKKDRFKYKKAKK
jgi:IPT/TIG domain